MLYLLTYFKTAVLQSLEPNLSVCSLFLMHDKSFERICTKFGKRHPYTVHMVMGVSERSASWLAQSALRMRTFAAVTQAHTQRES